MATPFPEDHVPGDVTTCPCQKCRLMVVIAQSVEVAVASHDDGSRTVRGLDAFTSETIADAVLHWRATERRDRMELALLAWLEEPSLQNELRLRKAAKTHFGRQ
jgi:hypothetical protein